MNPLAHFARMKWQDQVLSVGQVVFMIGLLPSLTSAHKPDAATSFITAFMLACFLIVYGSFKLWVTFGATAILVLLWFVLGVQAVA